MTRSHRIFPAAWQIIWPVLLHMFLIMLISMVFGSLIGTMWTVFLAGAATSLILYPLYRRRMAERLHPVGRAWRVRMDHVEACACIMVMAAAGCLFFNQLIAISGITRFSAEFEEVNNEIYSVPIWLQILTAGLAAPFAEELVFRGMGYARLRNETGVTSAAVISALIFGLYHGNLIQAVYTFGLGIMLAIVYEHFNGLFSAILFHVTANITSILLTVLAERFPGLFGNLLFTIGLIFLCGLVLVLIFLKTYDKKRRITN